MPSSRPSKISNRQWEEHKSVIERLYLRDNLTLQGEDGCEGVIAHMSRVHAFNASLSQYEDRLKHWGIRKYLTQDDWIIVKRMLDERGAQGKDSAVYVSGKALKDSQVRKGISRPGVRNAVHQDTRPASLDIQLPSYLEVRSPELLPQQEGVLQENTLHIPEDGCEPNEPCPVSEEQLDLLGCSLVLSRSPQVNSTLETQYIQSDRRIPDDYLMQGMVVSPTTDFAGPETEIDMSVQRTIRRKVLELIPSDTISFTGILPWNTNIPELKELQSSSQTISRMAYIRSTKSMIPACHTSNLADMTQGASILRIAVYELVNRKFLVGDHCSTPVECMMRYLQQDRSLQSFAKLKKHFRSPSLSDALHRNLFLAALCVKAYPIMNDLLVASAAPKSLILPSSFYTHKQTNELAAILYICPSELLTTILRCCDASTKAKLKAISNSYNKPDIRPSYSALIVRPENAKLLHDQGFELNWLEIVRVALSSGDCSHVESIMGSMPHSGYRQLVQETFYLNDIRNRRDDSLGSIAIRNLSEKEALWFISTLERYIFSTALPRDQSLTTDDTISIYTPFGYRRTFHTKALQVAISREYNTVINHLISNGTSITSKCLYEATSLKRIDLIERFLKAGVSPVEIVHSDSVFKKEIATPYAKALRIGYHEALRLFDQQPFNTPRLDAQCTILLAAAEIGDRERFSVYLESVKHTTMKFDSIMELKSIVNSESSDYKIQTCLASVQNIARGHGHNHILEALFEAGIMPSLGLFEDAIRSRDRNRLTELFTASNGTSPLGLSRSIARIGDHGLTEFILGCIDFQETTSTGEFLKQAILLNNVILVEQLLCIGINPNSLFDFNPLDHTEDHKAKQKHIGSLETPLIVAIRCRNKHIINMLLKHRAFLNPQPEDYRSPINDFKTTVDIQFLKRLDRKFLSALEAAVQCQDMELIYDLLSKGADPYDSNALVGLIKLGNYDMLKTVLQEQRCKKYSGVSNVLPAFLEALSCDNSDIAHLLSHHADLESLSVFRIDDSTLNDQYAKVLDDRAYITSVIINALGRIIHGFACQQYSLGTVRTLLHCGSNTEAVCILLSSTCTLKLVDRTNAFTPLHLAVFWDSSPLLNLLKEHGANINGSFNNLTKRTPLQLAAELGHLDMVYHLIRLNADVNWPPTPCKGFTALQLAAKHGFYRIAEVLLEHQAVVDWPAARICGRTAFEAATENGRLDMMLLLVRSGADLVSSAGNKQFERAIEFAKARGEEPAITLAHELREIVQRVTLEAGGEAFDALLERVFAS